VYTHKCTLASIKFLFFQVFSRNSDSAVKMGVFGQKRFDLYVYSDAYIDRVHKVRIDL